MEQFMQKLAAYEHPIIVEGKKDAAALAKLGCRTVITLHGPLYAVIERISERHKRTAILTDLDREGKKLYSILARGLREHGVSIDNSFREYLFRHTSLRQIEGLATYCETHAGTFSGNPAKRIRRS